MLQGSNSGAAIAQLRGLIVHDHIQTTNSKSIIELGGAVATNGETRLAIFNANFVRNTAIGLKFGGKGGAIYAQGGSLAITGAQFTGNQAKKHGIVQKKNAQGNGGSHRGEGGAIYSSATTLAITRAAFTGNHAFLGSGGAIAMAGGTMTIASARFTNNEAYFKGGAIFVSSGTLTMTSVEFRFNRINYQQGGSFGGGAVHSGGTLTISGAQFVGNQAKGGVGQGGAIFILGNTLTITNAQFLNNRATRKGGGAIFAHHEATIQLLNVTFDGNKPNGLFCAGNELKGLPPIAVLSDTRTPVTLGVSTKYTRTCD